MCYNKSTIEQLGELQEEYAYFKPVKDKNAFEGLPLFNATRFQWLPIFAFRGGELKAFKAMWWLIPHWSKDGKAEATSFNARIETADIKPLFAQYFKSRRCLIPVNAFYEYNGSDLVEITLKGRTKKVKQPSVIMMKEENSFMLGGIFSVWVDPKTGEEKPSYSVLTTEPNNVVSPIHDRMPVIIEEKYFQLWLDREYKDTKELKGIAKKPYPASKMKVYKVDAQYLYDRTHQDKKCWKKV